MPPAETARRTLLRGTGYGLAREAAGGAARYVLSGDVDAAGAEAVLRALEADGARGGEAELAMEEAELTEAKAVAVMVDAVRCLTGRFGRVRLVRAPQMLAHTIYRAGMLRGPGALELIAPREEEGRAN